MRTVLTKRFREAAAWAAAIHNTHYRKGTDIPYVSHLFAVAALVLEDGGTEDEAIAALLHDAVEDGQATLEEIRADFGDEVAQIVDACSDTDVIPKPPWKQRKQHYLDHLREGATESALRVSNADKLHNARSLLADYRATGDELWTRFNEDAQSATMQLWYYGELVDVFCERRTNSRLPEELARVVGELQALALPSP